MTPTALIGNSISARLTAIATQESPYPPSFDNNPWLYGFGLAALLAIGMFGIITWAWMVRDIWRDRFIDHPLFLAFAFRSMIASASAAAFLRCLPEVAYMTCDGEVPADIMSRIMLVKRAADIVSLPAAVTWMAVLVLIYPFVMISLRYQTSHGAVKLDPIGVWPRLARAAMIFITVIVIATMMAIAKGAMGHS